VDWKTQQNNRVNNRILKFNEEEHTISGWSQIKGISQSTISARLKMGWTIDRALNTPIRHLSPKDSKKYTLCGESLDLNAWSKRTNIPRTYITDRMNRYGWSFEKAV